MNGRRATGFVLGALTAVTLVVVSGCSTVAVPAGPSEQPSAVTSPNTRPTLHAAAKTDPDPVGDFVDGADDSDAAEEPTFTDAELSDQVEQATRGFVAASLTRGYPDKNDKASLRRTERLMTPKAARQQKLEGDNASKGLYARHERTRAEVSSVNSTILTSDQARAKVQYRLVTERYRGGTWRTVKTGQPQEKTFDLVDKSGEGWLVRSIS